MERKSLWKNFLLLTVGSLLALHLNVTQAADNSEDADTTSDTNAECVLTLE